MTQNQIAYQNLLEVNRANRAKEDISMGSLLETTRANKAKESLQEILQTGQLERMTMQNVTDSFDVATKIASLLISAVSGRNQRR